MPVNSVTWVVDHFTIKLQPVNLKPRNTGKQYSLTSGLQATMMSLSTHKGNDVTNIIMCIVHRRYTFRDDMNCSSNRSVPLGGAIDQEVFLSLSRARVAQRVTDLFLLRSTSLCTSSKLTHCGNETMWSLHCVSNYFKRRTTWTYFH